MARLTKERREPLRDAVSENAVRYWANSFICEQLTALLDTIDALESEKAALTEKMECEVQPLAEQFAENLVGTLMESCDGVDPESADECDQIKRVVEFNVKQLLERACADRDARVRMERAAALESAADRIQHIEFKYDGTSPRQEAVSAIRALIPTSDASALAEHDAALRRIISQQNIERIKIGEENARNYKELLESRDAYVQEKVAARWTDANAHPPDESLGYVLARIDTEKAREWGLQSEDNRRFYEDNLQREVDMMNTIFVRHWIENADWLTHWMPMPASPSGDSGGAK